MPSRDHMLGFPPVLDAINPRPPRKPPLGPRPKYDRTVVPERISVRDRIGMTPGERKSFDYFPPKIVFDMAANPLPIWANPLPIWAEAMRPGKIWRSVEPTFDDPLGQRVVGANENANPVFSTSVEQLNEACARLQTPEASDDTIDDAMYYRAGQAIGDSLDAHMYATLVALREDKSTDGSTATGMRLLMEFQRARAAAVRPGVAAVFAEIQQRLLRSVNDEAGNGPLPRG
jgi:hypothetical protein